MQPSLFDPIVILPLASLFVALEGVGGGRNTIGPKADKLFCGSSTRLDGKRQS